MRKKLVDASIALVAFVLLSTAGDALMPRFAHADAFMYCAPSSTSCPAWTGYCVGCTPTGVRGTCTYSIWGLGCTPKPNSCYSGSFFCDCNSAACS